MGVLFTFIVRACVYLRIICSSVFSPILLVLEMKFMLIKAWQQAPFLMSYLAGPKFCVWSEGLSKLPRMALDLHPSFLGFPSAGFEAWEPLSVPSCEVSCACNLVLK